MLWMYGRDFMILGDLLWILWIFIRCGLLFYIYGYLSDVGYCFIFLGQMSFIACDFHNLIYGYRNALIFIPYGR